MGAEEVDTTPFVVVITGAPGAGKTTLGWELSRSLHVPFLSRDDIKTGLHVTHRSNDPTEVWRFSESAFNLFFAVTHRLLAAKVSVVIEAAFHADRATESLEELAALATVLHIPMSTPTDVSLLRYRERAESGSRHPAHNDLHFAAAMEDGTKDLGVYEVVLPHSSLRVDATDGWNPPIEEIVEFVKRSL